jgi:hypothetical protein
MLVNEFEKTSRKPTIDIFLNVFKLDHDVIRKSFKKHFPPGAFKDFIILYFVMLQNNKEEILFYRYLGSRLVEKK